MSAPAECTSPTCPKPLPCALARRIPSPPSTECIAVRRRHQTAENAGTNLSPGTSTASLSMSPCPAMGGRACLATPSATRSNPPSASPPASLFYCGHGMPSKSCGTSLVCLSQSALGTSEGDARGLWLLPACPPRGATARASVAADTVSATVTCEAAPSEAVLAECETAPSVFAVNGCVVRHMPQYPVAPTSRPLPKLADDTPSPSPSPSDPPSLDRVMDKMSAEWTSWGSSDNNIAAGTGSEFWESSPKAEDPVFLLPGALVHLVNRDGARRSAVPRAPEA